MVIGINEFFGFLDTFRFFYTFSIIITYKSKQHDKKTSKMGFPINENFPLNKVVGVKKNQVKMNFLQFISEISAEQIPI